MDEGKEENDIVIKLVFEEIINDKMMDKDEEDNIVKIKITNK